MKLLTRKQKISKNNRLRLKNPDILQICNGHDFMKTFASFFGGNLKKEDVERNFRIANTKEDFEKTKLYQNIQEWIKTNK